MLKALLVFIFPFLGLQAIGQLEGGIFAGISNYQGDLVDKPYKSSKGAFGLSLGMQVSSRFSIRGQLTFAKVAGADSLNTQADLKLRNLSFQAPVTELAVLGEFASFDLDYKNWTPYVFAGIAIYHFNPYTYDRTGKKVMLQPLGTEGQGLPGYGPKYSLTQLAIPFGGGIKFVLNENVRLGFEIGLRKLFTDYLDDLSSNYPDQAALQAQNGSKAVELSYRGGELPGGNTVFPSKGETRGSPKYKDYYYFTGFHLTFLLPQSGHTAGKRMNNRNRYGCPVVQ